MQQKKILVISRGFRAGDAITTLNLFSQWPKTDLYCASMVGGEFAPNFNQFYVLGSKEVSFCFPFTYFASIGKSYIANVNDSVAVKEIQRKSIKRTIYEKMFIPLLQLLDLYETRFNFHLSDDFAGWIEEVSPDIIYTSLGDIPMARFIIDIHKRFPNIKIALHCFDDWAVPTYYVVNEAKHREKAESLLKEVISISSYRFTSSDKMALEYKDRYGYEFKCFPNPVRIGMIDGEIEKSPVPNILFAGKIGWHNNLAIKDMMKSVDNLNRRGVKVQFDIYTDCSSDQRNYFLGSTPESTIFHKPIPNSQILKVLKESHILFLPISITKQSEKFTRYSMSTKMGEYLSTGIPTIYCGPSSIAMTEFLKARDCAIIIEKPGTQIIEEAVLSALDGSARVKEMCANGIKLAYSYFNIVNISADFTKTLHKNES